MDPSAVEAEVPPAEGQKAARADLGESEDWEADLPEDQEGPEVAEEATAAEREAAEVADLAAETAKEAVGWGAEATAAELTAVKTEAADLGARAVGRVEW